MHVGCCKEEERKDKIATCLSSGEEFTEMGLIQKGVLHLGFQAILQRIQVLPLYQSTYSWVHLLPFFSPLLIS